MLLTVLVLLLGAFTSAYAQCEVTPDFLSYGVEEVGDIMHPMNDIPVNLGTVSSVPYNALGETGTGLKLTYSQYYNAVRVEPIPLSAGDTGIILRPRKPTADDATDRVGEFFWRHSTDPATLQRVNDLLCGPYDGVLVVTFRCYADDDQGTKSSFQIWLAYTSDDMVAVFVYDDPLVLSEGFIRDNLDWNAYPLSEPDILADYITAIDVTALPTVANGQTLPTLSTPIPCPIAPCCGAYLADCGPIARPDPRCDPMTCAWGSVTHTYSCPGKRTCEMNCYGCADAPDTPICEQVIATMSCEDEPRKVSTCSKTAGVGIMLFMYVCADSSTGQEVEITCQELCCCEAYQYGGVGTYNAIHCTSAAVFNFGYGEGGQQDKRAYCPGYGIPEWN